MSSTVIEVDKAAFKTIAVDIKITTESDKVALVEAIRRGNVELTHPNTFVSDLSNKLQRL